MKNHNIFDQPLRPDDPTTQLFTGCANILGSFFRHQHLTFQESLLACTALLSRELVLLGDIDVKRFLALTRPLARLSAAIASPAWDTCRDFTLSEQQLTLRYMALTEALTKHLGEAADAYRIHWFESWQAALQLTAEVLALAC
jgi:hypothetical protein